jgi:hypothetical protein
VVLKRKVPDREAAMALFQQVVDLRALKKRGQA